MFTNYCISTEFNRSERVVIAERDSLEALKELPGSTFRLVISSPPYNIGKAYEKQVDIKQYLEWQRSILKELVRIISDDGSLVWQTGNFVNDGEVFPLDIYFYPMFKDFGLKLRNRIIWHFGHGLHAKKRFSGRYETLLWFTKSDSYLFNLDPVRIPSKYPGKRHYKGKNKGQASGNPMGKNPSDFWTFLQQEWEGSIFEIPNVKANHSEKTAHPCQFPIELVERCVLSLTNEDDWVLDPFGGVGSSLIAAIKNNRCGMSIDRNSDYIEVAKKRVQDYYNGQLKIRPLGKPVHEPTGRERVSQVPTEWQVRQEKEELF